MLKIIKQIITDLLDALKLSTISKSFDKWEKAKASGKRPYLGTHPAIWMAQAIYENKTAVRGLSPEQQQLHLVLAIAIFEECVGLKDEKYMANLFNHNTIV